LTIAVGAYLCGRFLDWGFSPRTVATATGVIMLVPAALWGWSMLRWRERSVEMESLR
jgi:predicted MFS family arabinose efflux permease